MSENIKVAVRCRPFNSREIERKSVLIIEMMGNATYITDPKAPISEPRKYSFDHR